MVVFAIGLFAVPQAFADHDEVTIENAAGSSTPGCEPECFIPSTVTIKADTEVTWENNDTAAHVSQSGTAADGPSEYWNSSLIMAGQSYTKSFEGFEPGTYPYYCAVHPWMTGTIILEDGASSTPADTVPPQVLVPDDIVLQTEIQNDEFQITFNPQALSLIHI